MREYDFSQLTKPLHKCSRAYTSATKDGRFQIYVVQAEGMVPDDQAVYTSGDVNDARDAAIELNNMIKAAWMLSS